MTRPKPKTAHHHGNLREALVDYALQAAEGGVLDDLSLRKATRALGVSPGAAYRHFADREALLRTVAQRGFDGLAARFEAVMPFDSTAADATAARARFEALAREYVGFAGAQYGLWRLMFGPHGLATGAALARPSTYAWLGKALEELAGFGVIGPVTEEAQFFAWSAIHGLSDLSASPAIAEARGGDPVAAHCAFILSALAPAATR